MNQRTITKLAAVGMCLLMLGACGEKNEGGKSEQEQQQSMIESAQKDGNMQEGADVTTGRDSSGNATFQYSNPDGSGGGGVALD